MAVNARSGDRRRVVLVYPGFGGDDRSPINPAAPGAEKVVPMGCMALGACLEREGWAVTLIDGRFLSVADLLDEAVRRAEGALCVGISAMTVQVREGLDVADAVRAAHPGVPIVWGGVHATAFPEQTAADPACDYVVTGEGEVAFAGLIKAMAEGRTSPSAVAGLVYADPTGRIHTSPAPPPADPASYPPPAYHLLDLGRYVRRRSPDGRQVRGMDVLASRGCPYRCAFCLNPSLGQRRWRPRPVEQVLAEVDTLVDAHGIDHIWFMDDYFFGRRERTDRFVEYFLSRGGRVTWEANLRASDVRPDRLADTDLARLKHSGLCAVRIGMESGSERMLRRYRKDITVADIERSVRRLVAHGIMPIGFWMMGAPGETRGEIARTLELIWRLHEIHPSDPHWVPGMFRPYPGSDLYAEAKRLGFAEPDSLRAWAGLPLWAGYVPAAALPWLPDGRWLDDLQRYYSRWLSAGSRNGWQGVARRAIYGPLGRVARWRCKTRRWGLRVETWPFKMLRRVAGRLGVPPTSSVASLCGGLEA